MAEMKTSGSAVSIAAMDRSRLDKVVELYNCSEGYRYATGISFPVTREDIALKLDRLEASQNEFFSGIYIKDCDYCTSDLVGVICGILHGNTLWIKLIAILPQYRNRGIGSTATGEVFAYCKAACHIEDVLLSVIGENKPGVNFWIKQGFSETGRFTKALFGGAIPYEVLIMRKKL